jgi:glycosyltransferase involved in cell wall biosynthesis
MVSPNQVSCVIPYAGAEKYISEVVSSALSQGFGEIIIVNDGFDSRPLSSFLLQPTVKIISHLKPAGCPLARNAGIKAVSNPYVVLLDHDDVLCPGYLPAMLSWIEKKQLRCAAATLFYIGESSRRVGSIVSRHPDFFLPSGFFAEARLIAEAGYFPDSLSDDLLFFNAIRKLADLTTCPSAKVLYRIHPKAESSLNTSAWWAFNQLLPLYNNGTHSLETLNLIARNYAAGGVVPSGMEDRFISRSPAFVRLASRNAYACWLNRDFIGIIRYGCSLVFHLPALYHTFRYKWSRARTH